MMSMISQRTLLFAVFLSCSANATIVENKHDTLSIDAQGKMHLKPGSTMRRMPTEIAKDSFNISSLIANDFDLKTNMSLLNRLGNVQFLMNPLDAAPVSMLPVPAFTQSSTTHSAPADRAMDGNDATNWGSSSCTHTANEANPWWQVQLGYPMEVAAVQLINRGDCCKERLDSAKVQLLKAKGDGTNFIFDCTPTVSNAENQGNNTFTIFCDIEQSSYRNEGYDIVKVSLDTTQQFSLCEVKLAIPGIFAQR